MSRTTHAQRCEPMPEALRVRLETTRQDLADAEAARRDTYAKRDAFLTELLRAGYTQQKAGALLGISPGRVTRILQRSQ